MTCPMDDHDWMFTSSSHGLNYHARMADCAVEGCGAHLFQITWVAPARAAVPDPIQRMWAELSAEGA